MTPEDHAPSDLSIPYGGFFSTLLDIMSTMSHTLVGNEVGLTGY